MTQVCSEPVCQYLELTLHIHVEWKLQKLSGLRQVELSMHKDKEEPTCRFMYDPRWNFNTRIVRVSDTFD
jgi:hypothetical protein